MDGSNGPNNNGQQGGPQGQPQGQKRDLIYAERMRERAQGIMTEQKMIAELAKPYNAYAKQAMERTSADSQSLFYTAMGISVERSRKGATKLFGELCGMNERELEQPIADAISEWNKRTLRTMAVFEWGLFAGVSAFVFRKWRRQADYHLVGYKKYFWPTTRIVWYCLLGFGLISPAVNTVVQVVQSNRLLRDPRLQGIKIGLPEGVNPANFQQGAQNSPHSNQNGDSPASYDDASSTDSWQSGSKPSIQEQATAWRQSDTEAQNRTAWDQSPSSPSNYSRNQSNEPAPIQENSAWDSSSPIDDASPVAPSAISQNIATRPGESSWDRLRRQAGVQGRQPQQPPQARQPPPSQGGWGENTDTSSQFGGSSRSTRDDYSYSAADFEKSTAKDQAQREFDKLLDQERQGVDQENKRWR